MDELERELLSIVTRELGEVRIMACRSKLGSDKEGEQGRGRFLLGRFVSLGLGNREAEKTQTERENRERTQYVMYLKLVI